MVSIAPMKSSKNQYIFIDTEENAYQININKLENVIEDFEDDNYN